MSVAVFVLALPVLLWTAVLVAFARPLAARWREPVLCRPVLIIESDDWGAGPLTQADALNRLSDVLLRVRDCEGRPAVMTLGVVLEIPDGERIAAAGGAAYHGLPLTDARFSAVRSAIQTGVETGVFVPQLHGQCHYWPAALLAAARQDDAVRAWLLAQAPAATEALPSYLQSRWVDAGSLPSQALPADSIRQAVSAEVQAYQAVFGQAPRVAVATTFVWNEAVEAAWAHAGIEVVITPGHRATCRNAAGEPACIDARMLTGDRSDAGPMYLLRDVYFEPALGHEPKRLADGLGARSRQGRACLVETHRFNFLQAPEASLAALEVGLNAALAVCPQLRFLTPLELAQAIERRDRAWIEYGFGRRLSAWRARLAEIPRFPRAARWSGLGWMLA